MVSLNDLYRGDSFGLRGRAFSRMLSAQGETQPRSALDFAANGAMLSRQNEESVYEANDVGRLSVGTECLCRFAQLVYIVHGETILLPMVGQAASNSCKP
jgi:hypothetical protein